MKSLLFILLLGCVFETRGAVVVLEWNANTETNVAGYRVYSGAAPRAYASVVDVNSATNHTNDYAVGEYFLAVTAYDTDGLESDFSDELALFIVAPPAPRFESNTLTWAGSGSWRVRWTTDTSTNQQIFSTNRVALAMFPPKSTLQVRRYELGVTNVISDFSAPLLYQPPTVPRALQIRVSLQRSEALDKPFGEFAQTVIYDAIDERAFYRAQLEIIPVGLRIRNTN